LLPPPIAAGPSARRGSDDFAFDQYRDLGSATVNGTAAAQNDDGATALRA
jgi:hypothetical protein